MSDDALYLKDLLDAYAFQSLRDMAGAAGLDLGGGGRAPAKSKTIAVMCARFFTEERVLASWKRLARTDQQVVERLLRRGGAARTRSFQRELLRDGLATEAPRGSRRWRHRDHVPYAKGYVGDPQDPESRVFEDVIARLTYHGLVFCPAPDLSYTSSPYKLRFHPADNLLVPEMIRQYLPNPKRDTPPWTPERVLVANHRLLLSDLYLYWDFCRRQDVGLIAAGYVGKRWLGRINESLLQPDPLLGHAKREDETGHLYLLRQLLEVLGLLRVTGRRLSAWSADPPEIPSFWSLPEQRQLQMCIEAWVETSGAGRVDRSGWVYNADCSAARATVVAHLQALERDEWYELDELVEQLQGRNPDFLFPEHSSVASHRSSAYYYGYYSSGSNSTAGDLVAELGALEREFVVDCLTGPLSGMGLVELGCTGDEVRGIRLRGPALRSEEETASGDTNLQGDGAQGRLVVQPSFQIIAMGPVSLGLLARLDLICERERAGPGAFEYRLSRESLYRGQRSGVRAVQAVRLLEQESGAELPQNVRRSLEEWDAYHERIVLRTGVSLLQTAEPELLAELLAGPQTSESLARPLGDNVALVRKGRQQDLVEGLLTRGCFPAVSGAEPASADSSVVIKEDGSIRAIHVVPSLHVSGRLGRLAEPTGSREWQLTAESVKRATGSRQPSQSEARDGGACPAPAR